MTRREWLVLGILCTIQFLEAFDIFLLGKMAPLVAAGFRIAVADIAPVFVAQQVGLALGALIGGPIADRMSRARLLIVAGGLAGLATCVGALAPDLLLFAVVRFVAGLFMGAAAMAVLTVGASLGPRRASWVLTSILASNSLGISAGSLYVLLFVDQHGWRLGFWIVGLALAIAAASAASGEKSIRQYALRERGAQPSDKRDRAWSAQGTLRLGLCYMLTGGLIAALSSWAATFFYDRVGVSVQRFAGVGLVYAPAALLGMLGCGWLADRVPFNRLAQGIFIVHSAALAGLGLVPFQSPYFALIYFLSIVGQTAGQAILGLTVRANYPDGVRGKVFALAVAFGRAGGVIAPWLGAIALDSRLSLTAIYAISAIIPLVAILLLPEKVKPPRHEWVIAHSG